ncbi:MAG: SpoIIE family protein phosphatase [Ignavibacteria bacterium]|nr:SpoIIE family protein phosphatase [Ignavibacteria bacterium]
MSLPDQENIEFQRVRRNLTALIDFSKHINASLDIDFTLNNLLLSCFGKFLTSRGMVVLLRDQKMQIVASKGIPKDILDKFPPEITPESPDISSQVECFCSASRLLCQPILIGNQPIGYILLGEKFNKQPYTEEEIDFLKVILNIAATAIQNSMMIADLKNLNRRLDSKVNRLNSLFELSKEFGILTEEERIGKLLSYSLLGHFLNSHYAVIYFSDGKLRVLHSTIPKKVIQENFQLNAFIHFSEPLVGNELALVFPLLAELHFEVAVPMVHQKETKGMLLLGPKLDKSIYNTEDIEFITSFVSLAVISLENRRLFREALEKQRLEEELQIAQQIQKNLLPKEIPVYPGFEFAALTIPSKHVGGDYYDIIKLNEEKLCFAIADVSGKGVPASLLMANLQAFLKSICKKEEPIGQATALINDLVAENTSDGRFITFFWSYLDILNKKLTYVNAGHNPPLLFRNNSLTYLDKGGIILGVMRTLVPYSVDEVELQSGDCILMFTDGVTEAKNTDDNEYSDERLEKFFINHSSISARDLVRAILQDLQLFTAGAAQSDDITILVIKVL